MNLLSLAPPRVSSILNRQTSFARTSRQFQTLYRARIYTRPRCNHVLRGGEGTERRILRGPAITHNRATHIDSQPRIAENGAPNSITANSSVNAYKPPTSGLVSRLPASWIPYAELIRLDKPAGTYYLFAPCLFSTLLAAPLAMPIATPLEVLHTTALFFTGALIMRGAGCTVNDLWDRNLDPYVARTRLRPLARGALGVQQAIPFLGVQLFAGLALLLQLPTVCLFYGIPSLLLVGTYPLAKRVTHYPQFVLGLTFSWGAIMGFPALGIDLLSTTPALISAACLYGSCVAWTLIYDMIYAYQDIRDDAKAGIKSIALAQEANAKTFLTAVAGVQVALLAGAGAAVGAGPIFFVGSCGGALATLEHMIRTVNLESVEDCAAWFRNGVKITGGIIAVGLLGEYLTQYYGLYDGSQWERQNKATDSIAVRPS